MNIGKQKINPNLILAPMVGVNCTAFRILCKEQGAGLVSTPMISIDQLVEKSKKIINRTYFIKKEKPISIQHFGSDGKKAKQAVELIEDYADNIDFNIGCHDKDIVSAKAGAYYLKNPENIEPIISKITSNTNKPITEKIRIGWNEKNIITLKTDIPGTRDSTFNSIPRVQLRMHLNDLKSAVW